MAAVVNGGQIYTSSDSGASWTPRESERSWSGIVSSADGTILAAVVNPGNIYISIDSGASWSVRATDLKRNWEAVAMSNDGKKLAASSYMGTVYTSQDSGLTWISGNSIRDGYAITSSSDGNKILVAVPAGFLYTTGSFSKVFKGFVKMRKESTASYLLIVSSNAPKQKFTITAKKSGAKIFTFHGATSFAGSATVRAKINLAGYSLSLQFGVK